MLGALESTESIKSLFHFSRHFGDLFRTHSRLQCIPTSAMHCPGEEALAEALPKVLTLPPCDLDKVTLPS